MKKNLITILGLKRVPEVGYDFDDVIFNVEKLLDHFFLKKAITIRKKVSRLSEVYIDLIQGDYDEFLNLANSEKKLQKWREPYYGLINRNNLMASVLDLYFQINMVENWDVYNDILIHAYLEDVQPFL